MGRTRSRFVIFFVIATFLVVGGVKSTPKPKNSLFIYLKSVSCKTNPKLLGNVTCFAKSYSRSVSAATIYAVVKERITSVMVSCLWQYQFIFWFPKTLKMDFRMQYKYGTIYREILRAPRKFDVCFFMEHLDRIKSSPYATELFQVIQRSVPGFARPCPWRVILKNWFPRTNTKLFPNSRKSRW